MRCLEEVCRDIDLIESSIVGLCFCGSRLDDEYQMLMRQLNSLLEEKRLVSSKLVAVTDEIDIYEMIGQNKRINYLISKHDTCEIIGYIQVGYGVVYPIHGNLGYEIKEKYRGHGYALKALEVLCDVLVEHGMDDAMLCIRSDNIPSIKTAEGFGAVLVDSGIGFENRNKYRVDLQQKVKRRNNYN